MTNLKRKFDDGDEIDTTLKGRNQAVKVYAFLYNKCCKKRTLGISKSLYDSIRQKGMWIGGCTWVDDEELMGRVYHTPTLAIKGLQGVTTLGGLNCKMCLYLAPDLKELVTVDPSRIEFSDPMMMKIRIISQLRAENANLRNVIARVAEELACPISQVLPVDAVVAEDSRVYNRSSLGEWIRNASPARSPFNGVPWSGKFFPNVCIKNVIDELFKSGCIPDGLNS